MCGKTYYYWDTGVVGNFGDGFEIGDIVSWVANAFYIHGLCFLIDCIFKVFGTIAGHKLCFNT
jgi:hypothetical protein